MLLSVKHDLREHLRLHQQRPQQGDEGLSCAYVWSMQRPIFGRDAHVDALESGAAHIHQDSRHLGQSQAP